VKLTKYQLKAGDAFIDGKGRGVDPRGGDLSERTAGDDKQQAGAECPSGAPGPE